MATLTALHRVRLHEALTHVKAELPGEHHRWLMPIWRKLAWRLNDPEGQAGRDIRKARGRLYRALPETAKPDWRWALKALPDDGGWDVLRDWANDNGHGKGISSRKGRS